jgi:hypothetical protein
MASAIESMAVHQAAIGSFAPYSPASLATVALWRGIERRLAAPRESN